MAGKYAIIDGSSFFNMLRVNGVGQVNHRKWYQILRNRIGEAREFTHKPIHVVSVGAPVSIRKHIEGGGFEVLVE